MRIKSKLPSLMFASLGAMAGLLAARADFGASTQADSVAVAATASTNTSLGLASSEPQCCCQHSSSRKCLLSGAAANAGLTTKNEDATKSVAAGTK